MYLFQDLVVDMLSVKRLMRKLMHDPFVNAVCISKVSRIKVGPYCVEYQQNQTELAGINAWLARRFVVVTVQLTNSYTLFTNIFVPGYLGIMVTRQQQFCCIFAATKDKFDYFLKKLFHSSTSHTYHHNSSWFFSRPKNIYDHVEEERAQRHVHSNPITVTRIFPHWVFKIKAPWTDLC